VDNPVLEMGRRKEDGGVGIAAGRANPRVPIAEDMGFLVAVIGRVTLNKSAIKKKNKK
jgi:hypothetical protein